MQTQAEKVVNKRSSIRKAEMKLSVLKQSLNGASGINRASLQADISRIETLILPAMKIELRLLESAEKSADDKAKKRLARAQENELALISQESEAAQESSQKLGVKETVK